MTLAPKQDRLFTALSISLGLMPAVLVSVKGAYGIVALLLLALSIAALVVLARRGELDWHRTWRGAKPIWVPFCGFFLAFALSVLFTGDSLRGLDYPNRWIILLPILFALVAARGRIDYRYFWTGIAVGSVATAVLASYQMYVLHLDRAIGFMTQNPYGNLSVLLGLLCGVGALYQRSPRRGMLLALAGWGGMWASLLSVTRGGWPAVIPFVILLALHLRRLPRKSAIALLAAHVVLVAMAYPTAARLVSHRIDMAAQDLSIDNAQERSGTSVGARLAMWDISFQIFREHPIFGIGPTRFKAELHRKNTEQYRSADIYTQNVAHQEFLDAMARAGTIGGIALAALFAYPLAAIYRQRKTRPAWRSLGGLGVLAFLGAFLLFGLANTTLTNHTSLLFFIIGMSVLWAEYLQETDGEASTNG